MTEQKSVASFLKQNLDVEPSTEEVAFKRFPEPFVIRELTNKEVDKFRKQTTIKRKNPQNGQIETQANQEKFGELMVASAVVVPDLNNKELQESYGTLADPIGLLKEMLKVGELSDLSEEVMKLSGINQDNLKTQTDEVKK